MQIPFLVRWHPVLALRYLPMVKIIRDYLPATIVEVGSGGLGIGPYLKNSFIGIDLSFSPPFSKWIIPIIGSGLSVPIKSRCADIVISSDVLEHIDPKLRPKGIEELCRITKKCLIIGVPIGKPASQLDHELDRDYHEKHGTSHPFLTEHVEHGLPEYEEIIRLINMVAQKQHRTISLKTIPNQNLNLRKFLLKGWISTNFLVNIFFRKILLLAIPLMQRMNYNPVYRHIFIIKFNN